MQRKMVRRHKAVPLPKAASEPTRPPQVQRLSQNLIQRAVQRPESLTPSDMVTLQRTVGNRALQRMLTSGSTQTSPLPVVQAKLMVGSADDPYEREANQVARQMVGRMRSQNAVPQSSNAEFNAQQSGPGSAMPDSALAGGLVAPQVENRIRSTRAGGQPLPTGTRTAMEQAFGTDFRAVRIHHSQQADSLNRALDARAFTSGQDIYFRQGEFQPGNVEGQGLLAHELTHVVQQSQSPLQRAATSADASHPMAAPEARLPTIQQAKASGYALGQRPLVTQRAQPDRIHRCGDKKKKGKGKSKAKSKSTGMEKKSNKGGGNELDKFKEAYQMARTYHGTKEGRVPDILEQGLRIDKTGTGAIAMNSEYNIDEQVVHLGLDRETSAGYAGSKQGLLRPFLPSDRRPNKRAQMWGMKNYQPAWPEDVPRKEIVYDEKHRGGGAVWTGEDVPSMNIMSGTHEQLLDSTSLGDKERLETILDTIGTHYYTVHGEEPPDLEELRRLYTQLVRERRLSMTDIEWFG